jgi:DNA invertase Pin-like site-specific DNA recombinase
VTKTKHNTDLIPAVAYLRKSTRGERQDRQGRKRQKQEKSIEQQRAEVIKLAQRRGYAIIRWYEDEGISGWKRDAARPGFAQMLADARTRRDVRAIVTDDADRFSRATWRKCVRDVDDLAEAGIETISCVKDGDFRIADETDPGEAHRLVAIAMANHEYSRRLARRIAIARRNAAADGKRSGGPAPYGLVNDDAGGLAHGDAAKVAVVRWLFDQFGNHHRSLGWLAGDLNSRGVPPPRGQRWYQKSISVLLRQPAYRGDFQFNIGPRGQFFAIDAEGEVVERAKLDGQGRIFRCVGAYAPVVEPALFDRVQERLAALAADPSRRNRGSSGASYALTGVLVCDHCGCPMYGAQIQRYTGKGKKDQKPKPGKRSPTVYRCNGVGWYGNGTCRHYQVREGDILPFVLRLLGEEIDVMTMRTHPPDNLVTPIQARAARQAQLLQERQQLAERIDTAEDNLLRVRDARTRQSLDAKVSALRDRLEQLDRELAATPTNPWLTNEEIDALNAWWDDFNATAVRMPINPDNPEVVVYRLNPYEDQPQRQLVSPLKVNDALRQLGCEVRLRWREEKHTSMRYKVRGKDGKMRRRGGRPKVRYVLAGGRFRLGRQKGTLAVTGTVVGPVVTKGAAAAPTASRTSAAASATPVAARR